MTTKNYIGWLFPDGTFWNCEYGMHISAADDICEHLHINTRNTEALLESHGFIKITIVDGLYFIEDNRCIQSYSFEQLMWFKARFAEDVNSWYRTCVYIMEKQLEDI